MNPSLLTRFPMGNVLPGMFVSMMDNAFGNNLFSSTSFGVGDSIKDPSENSMMAPLTPMSLSTITSFNPFFQEQFTHFQPGIPNMISGMQQISPYGFSTPIGSQTKSNQSMTPTVPMVGNADLAAFMMQIDALVSKALAGVGPIMRMVQAMAAQQPAGVSNTSSPTKSDTPTNPNGSGVQETSTMKALGQKARQVADAWYARNPDPSKNYWCAGGVVDTLKQMGLYDGVSHNANEMYPYLKKDSKLKEIQVASYADLKNLPAGCIVVWDANNNDWRNQWGHIMVTDGKGGENSDRHHDQILNIGSKFHVFVPAN